MADSLVLLHGWGLNRCVWDPFIDQLARRRSPWGAHPLDLPGYGCPTVSPYALQELARELLIKAPNNAVWLGLSLGGMVALQAAILQPQRVAKLILVGTTPRFVKDDTWQYGTDPEVFARFAGELEADYPNALQRFLLLQAGRADQARRLVRELSAHIDHCGRPSAQVLRDGIGCLLRADLRANLFQISCPALIVQGALDRITCPTAAEYLHAHIKGSRLHTLYAGHLPFVSHPVEFADAVEGFLCV